MTLETANATILKCALELSAARLNPEVMATLDRLFSAVRVLQELLKERVDER